MAVKVNFGEDLFNCKLTLSVPFLRFKRDFYHCYSMSLKDKQKEEWNSRHKFLNSTAIADLSPYAIETNEQRHNYAFAECRYFKRHRHCNIADGY